MLSTWRILAAVAAGSWTSWPEKESQPAATGRDTSRAAWVYGRSTRSHAPRFKGTLPSAFRAWWMSTRLRPWTGSGPPTSPSPRCRSDSSTWWRLWISSPGSCSAGSSPMALTRSSAWTPWRWRWEVAVSQRSSTLIRAASSHLVTSWPGFRLRRARSAGQAGSAATTISWWNGCGAQSSTRRSVCMPTAMAGMQAEISLARSLWRYCHVRPHSSLGGRTPYEVYTEMEPFSSRPELTMSGARTVQ